jgi:hypothetical protein
MAKRSVEVEKLLHWAYRDELSKRATSSAEGIWDHIEEYGQNGGIDPGHGAAQRYPHFGLPHPDAEKIEKAVGALADQCIDLEASRDGLMGDLAQLLVRRDVLAVKTLRTTALVTMHAYRGDRPDWCPSGPRAYWIEATHGPRGRPQIVGECRGKNLYTAGSYCPLQWDPSPLAIALERLDYVAWWRGLRELSETLELDAHQALPPAAPELPWFDKKPPGRIFRFGEVTRDKLPLRPLRDPAGPPPRRPRHGLVTMPEPAH